jgi:O-succinylbenzoate synthase
MRITGYGIYTYALPLHHPLNLGGRRVERREGLLLRMNAGDAEGWGETAPLPGFSLETLDEARAQLTGAAAGLVGQVLDMDAVLTGEVGPEAAAPSVRFGLETAYLALLEATAGLAWSGTGGLHGDGRLQLCRLLGSADELAQAAAQGFSCCKLKVGRTDPARETAALRDALPGLPPGGGLRLDANRAWSLEEAAAFCGSVADLPVQYVEEPLHDPLAWAVLTKRSEVPTAIDESLLATGEALLREPGGPRWVVLKPSLVGGVSGTLRLAQLARATGRQVVVSSMYETGVGYRTLVRLAATLQDPCVAAGLDTLRALAEDVVAEDVWCEAGEIDAAGLAAGGMTVRVDRLEQVTGG